MTNAPLVVAIPGAVLAHQGGWDEILLVVGPVAIVVGLLVLARHRVRRRSPADPQPDAPSGVSERSDQTPAPTVPPASE